MSVSLASGVSGGAFAHVTSGLMLGKSLACGSWRLKARLQGRDENPWNGALCVLPVVRIYTDK